MTVITACKRSLWRLCFYTCVSVILFTGRVVSQHALQVSRPTPRGKVEEDLARGSPGPHPRGKLRGIWPGGWSPGPHPRGGLQAHTQGEVSRPTPEGRSRGPCPGGYPSMHWGRPPKWLLLWAVRILLECILVTHCNYHMLDVSLGRTPEVESIGVTRSVSALNKGHINWFIKNDAGLLWFIYIVATINFFTGKSYISFMGIIIFITKL